MIRQALTFALMLVLKLALLIVLWALAVEIEYVVWPSALRITLSIANYFTIAALSINVVRSVL